MKRTAALFVLVALFGSSVVALAATPPKKPPAAKTAATAKNKTAAKKKPAKKKAASKHPKAKPILWPKKVQLVGTVTNTSITLLAAKNKPVKVMKAGNVYAIIYVKTKKQNFDLRGPKGFEPQFTPEKFKGMMLWKFKLIPGDYTFFSDDNSTKLHGSFTVAR